MGGLQESIAHLGKLDAIEYENRFELHVDMPGIPRDDIHVSVKDGMLQVRGGSDVKKEEKDEETGKVLFRERQHTSYHRSLQLPDTVDVEAITAKNSDGVLQVTLPKRKASEPQEHKIPVLGGDDQRDSYLSSATMDKRDNYLFSGTMDKEERVPIAE